MHVNEKPHLLWTPSTEGCSFGGDVTAAMTVHSASCLVPKVAVLTRAWVEEDTHLYSQKRGNDEEASQSN